MQALTGCATFNDQFATTTWLILQGYLLTQCKDGSLIALTEPKQLITPAAIAMYLRHQSRT